MFTLRAAAWYFASADGLTSSCCLRPLRPLRHSPEHRQQRHTCAYAEAEYQRAEGCYQHDERHHEQDQATAAHTFTLDADGRAALKKRYREAAQLCHPDRVAPAQQAAATAAFQAVQATYQRQDVAELQTQLAELRQGRFAAASAPTTVEALAARRDALAARHATLLRELAELRAAEAYQLIQAEEATRKPYLRTNRTALLAERDRLQAQAATPAVPADTTTGR